MKDYLIVTDSACDITPSVLAEWGVACADLSFSFEGEEKQYSNRDMDIITFYDRMRSGDKAKTSAVNPDAFLNIFEEALKEGKDVFYVGFSTGLSATCHSAEIAAQQLAEKYTENKIYIVDTLSASAGLGLLVYLAVEKKKEGLSAEENAAYIESLKLKVNHWVAIDDLEYLKRGGRISPTVAVVGKALGIKPIIHVNNEGKLVNVLKARGRKNAMQTLINKYGELAEDAKNGIVFISHSDCENEAKELAKQLKERYGVEVRLTTFIGTVIGAHTGPGTLVLFFVGKNR